MTPEYQTTWEKTNVSVVQLTILRLKEEHKSESRGLYVLISCELENASEKQEA